MLLDRNIGFQKGVLCKDFMRTTAEILVFKKALCMKI